MRVGVGGWGLLRLGLEAGTGGWRLGVSKAFSIDFYMPITVVCTTMDTEECLLSGSDNL